MPDVVGSAYVRIRAIADKVGDDIAKSVNDPKNKKKLDKSIDNLFKGLGKNGKIVWGAILGAPALGPAVQVIGAYIGQVISIVGSLGPAMAVGAGVGVAAMLSLKQATGVFGLAMKARTPELLRYQAAMKGLQTRLGSALQTNLLPALGGAAARLLPVIQGPLTQTSNILAQIVDRSSKFAASPMVSSRIQRALTGNNTAIAIFGTALNPILDMFLRIYLAVQPLLVTFAHWAVGMVTVADRTTQAADGAGRLVAFFQRGAATAAILGHAGGQALHGIYDILRLSVPAGNSLFDSIDQLATRFNQWTQTASGQNKIAAYFRDSRVIAAEVNKIIADLLKAFGKNLHYSGLDSLMHTLQAIDNFVNQFIPPLVAAFSSNGPGLGKVFGQFAQILTQLAQSGMFGHLATELQAILNIIGPIVTSPLGSTLIKWGIEGAAFSKVISLVPGSTQLASFAVKGLTGDLLKLLPAVKGTSKIGAIIKGIGVAMKGAFAFLAANPIILVVAAVVIGLVLMYMKVKWFRDFVNAAWRDIQAWSVVLWHGMQAAFQAIGTAATWLWQNVLQPAFAGIKVAFGVLVDAFQVLWRFYLHPVFELWKLEFQILVDIFKIGWTAMGYVIAIFAALLVVWWKVAIKPVWDAFSLAVRLLWNLVLHPVFDAIMLYFRLVGAAIQAVWTGVIRPIWTVFGAVVMAAWRGVIQPAFAAIRIGFSILGSALAAVYRSVIAPIWSTMVRAIHLVADTARTVFGGLKSVFSDVFSAVAGPIKGAINGLVDLLNGAIDLVNKVHIDIPDVPGIPHRGEHLGLNISKVPHLARGGTAYPGLDRRGVLARLAEAGRPERVEPLDSQGLSARDRALVAELAGPGRNLPPISILVYPSAGMDEEQLARLTRQQLGDAIASLA